MIAILTIGMGETRMELELEWSNVDINEIKIITYQMYK